MNLFYSVNNTENVIDSMKKVFVMTNKLLHSPQIVEFKNNKVIINSSFESKNNFFEVKI